MKRFATLLMILLTTLFLVACGAKSYKITTKTGKTYIASGDPEYDVQTETYIFQNEEGKKVILNQEDIEVIQEAD